MRSLLMLFLILSPFIALAQSYGLHPVLSGLRHAPVAQIADVAADHARMQMAAMITAVQQLLG